MKIKIEDVVSMINNSESFDEARMLVDLKYGCTLEDVYNQVSEAHDSINDNFKSIHISRLKDYDMYKQEINRMCCYMDLDDLVNGHHILNSYIEI